MAASKADQVREVTAGAVTFQREDGTTYSVAIQDLKRPQLMAAAGIAFPGSGVEWRFQKNEAVRLALRTGTLPETAPVVIPNKWANVCHECAVPVAPGDRVAVPADGTWRTYCADHAPAVPAPVSTPAPAVTPAAKAGAAGPLGDFLEGEVRRIVAETGADPAAIAEVVRETVASEIEAIRASLPVRAIRLPEREPATLPESHHETLPRVLQYLATGQHVMLTGPAGSGKSTLARQAADALGHAFYPMSVGPADMASKMFGFVDAGGTYHSTPARDAFEHGGVFLLDEGDNGHPSCLNALNAMLANGVCSFPDRVVERHPDFVCVMATNTFGTGPDAQYVGRQVLDAAFLDRFSIKVTVGYDEKLETSLALGYASTPETRQAIESWIVRCRGYRRAADTAGLRVIIGPRVVIAGAALLSVGVPADEVAEVTVLAGMDEATRRTIGSTK